MLPPDQAPSASMVDSVTSAAYTSIADGWCPLSPFGRSHRHSSQVKFLHGNDKRFGRALIPAPITGNMSQRAGKPPVTRILPSSSWMVSADVAVRAWVVESVIRRSMRVENHELTAPDVLPGPRTPVRVSRHQISRSSITI